MDQEASQIVRKSCKKRVKCRKASATTPKKPVKLVNGYFYDCQKIFTVGHLLRFLVSFMTMKDYGLFLSVNKQLYYDLCVKFICYPSNLNTASFNTYVLYNNEWVVNKLFREQICQLLNMLVTWYYQCKHNRKERKFIIQLLNDSSNKMVTRLVSKQFKCTHYICSFVVQMNDLNKINNNKNINSIDQSKYLQCNPLDQLFRSLIKISTPIKLNSQWTASDLIVCHF